MYLSFAAGAEQKRRRGAEHYRRGDAAGGRAQGAGQDPEPSLFCHGFFHAGGQSVAKARQRHGSPGAAPADERFVKPQGAEGHAVTT